MAQRGLNYGCVEKQKSKSVSAKVPEHQKQLTGIIKQMTAVNTAECTETFWTAPEKALLLIGVTGTKGKKRSNNFYDKEDIGGFRYKVRDYRFSAGTVRGKLPICIDNTCALDLYEILQQMQDGGWAAVSESLRRSGSSIESGDCALACGGDPFNLAEDHIGGWTKISKNICTGKSMLFVKSRYCYC